MSKDGELRITVKVEVRAGVEELVNAIGWVFARDYSSEEISQETNLELAVASCLRGLKSRRAIIEALKRAVHSDGDHFWTWNEGLGDRISSEVRNQALAAVQKAFKDLQR